MTRSHRGVQFPKRSSSARSEDAPGSPTSPRRKSDLADGDAKSQNEAPKQSDYEKKKANFITRALWTFVMIGIFFLALFSGHIYIMLIITVIQIISFKEVIAIASVPSRARQLNATKSLNWYWLATTEYFLYGESVIYYFKHIVLIDRVLLPLATHHRFISFMLYVIGFVFFVTSLKLGNLKFQFTNFAWTHMALFMIVLQAHFILNNVLEGMIWFFLPASLVITNDIFAYLCGITFGRTQLIKLSPKKTVEGFVGAWIMTVLFAAVMTKLLSQSKYFICPVNDLGANIFTGLQCDPEPVFIPQTYRFSYPSILPWGDHHSVQFTMQPMQLHSFVFATFASLIAPFGGFFASGLKRTFQLKDFGDSIPGHGGMTDRMDCQYIMGCFAYMYYHTFIALNNVTYGQLMEAAITSLTLEDQLNLVNGMSKYLEIQGVFDNKAMACITKAIEAAAKKDL